jgi:uncharacterized protein
MKRLIAMIIIFTFMGMQAAFAMGSDGSTLNGIQDKTASLTMDGQNFVKNLQNGNFKDASESFDGAMKAQLPMDKLETLWKGIIMQCGKPVEQQGTRYEAVGEYDVIYITCKFQMQTLDIKLVFNKSKQIAGLFFVPNNKTLPVSNGSDKAPEGVVETNVTVGSGEWILPGTLSMPKGKGPFPVVILVHGSGPNDRDETIMANKPFRDLAWGMASKGVAVLRYDKRTKVYADKIQALKTGITVKEEVVDDAVAATILMEKTKGIDKKRIYILGHSLGGMLIPRIAKEAKDAAGFIIMAGSVRPLEDIILEQMRYLISLDKKISKTQKAEVLNQTLIGVNNIKSLTQSSTKGEKELLGFSASFWLSIKGYNPAQTAKSIKKPMLILQGERDYQVTLKDFNLWKSNLSGNKNVSFKTYKDLNHLFITGKGKSTPEEYNLAGHVSQNVIDDICKWIKK